MLLRENFRVCVIEKETSVARHQSGSNSGVVHVGYNQKPGTLKARYVVEGSRRTRAFCRERGIPLFEGGILIVAKNESEVETLKELMGRGQSNGARVEWIKREDLSRHEPYGTGIAGLWAPEGASLDSKAYVSSIAREAEDMGAALNFSERVIGLREESASVRIQTDRRLIQAGAVVNAAGLHADRVAGLLGVGRDYRIIPFRGEYFEIVPEKRHLVRSHLYAAPDLNFPFLGVHLSRSVDGRVKAGPTAVLSPGRESYGRSEFNLRDCARMARDRAFWRMLLRPEFMDLARREIKKSFSTAAVLREAQELIPELHPGDLIRCGSGIRAQLVTSEGSMVDDLVIEETPRSVHVLNAVSPGLTCALPFADFLAQKAIGKLP
jgi:L-2-hydroxyglutarate oxidase